MSFHGLRAVVVLSHRNITRPGQPIMLMERNLGLAHYNGDKAQFVIAGGAPNAPIYQRSRVITTEWDAQYPRMAVSHDWSAWHAVTVWNGSVQAPQYTDANGNWSSQPDTVRVGYDMPPSWTSEVQYRVGDEETNVVQVSCVPWDGYTTPPDPAQWIQQATPPSNVVNAAPEDTSAAAPTAQWTNITRPGNSPRVGDRVRVAVHGPANQAVSVTASHNGSSSTSSAGQTNAQGDWSTEAVMSSEHIGSWSETWSVGGVQASPVLSFTVSAAPADQTNTDTAAEEDNILDAVGGMLPTTFKEKLDEAVEAVKSWPSWVWGLLAVGLLYGAFSVGKGGRS